jgi:hypothetical protein
MQHWPRDVVPNYLLHSYGAVKGRLKSRALHGKRRCVRGRHSLGRGQSLSASEQYRITPTRLRAECRRCDVKVPMRCLSFHYAFHGSTFLGCSAALLGKCTSLLRELSSEVGRLSYQDSRVSSPHPVDWTASTEQ